MEAGVLQMVFCLSLPGWKKLRLRWFAKRNPSFSTMEQRGWNKLSYTEPEDEDSRVLFREGGCVIA